MEKKRKINSLWAWILVSVKIPYYGVRYGGTRDIFVNYDTGEVGLVEQRGDK